MAPKNSDTDPSTPIARRVPFSQAPAAIAAAASTVETQPEGIAVESSNDPHPEQTDPGVGPPAPIRSLPPQMVGVVVPGPAIAAALGDPVARPPGFPSVAPPSMTPASPGAAPRMTADPAPAIPAAKQDSVELLLDGISGPRPGRARTTPQTGGHAAAAYHAEHDLRAGRPPAEQPNSASVERPPTPRAIPVAAMAARKAAQMGTAREAEPTVVTERALARRVVGALVGALLVVAGLFAAFHVTRSHLADSRPGAAPEPAAAAVAPAPLPAASAATSPSIAPALSPPAPSVQSAEPAASSEAAASESSAAAAGDVPSSTGSASAPAAASPPTRPIVAPSLVHRRRKVGLPAAGPGGGDVGEFKTTF